MYAQDPGMGGLGSKLKKLAKKVEKVARPLVKVGAVVTAGMFAPTLLPMVAGAALSKKAPDAPVDVMQQPLPPTLPATALTMPQATQAYSSGGWGPMQPIDQFAPAAAAPDMKKLALYGGAAAVGIGLLFALSGRRR